MIREFQKIYSRPVSFGLLAAAVLLSIGLSAFFIHNYGYEVHQDEKVFYYDGLDAVQVEKEAMENIPSVLSVENLNASIQYYRQFSDTKTANEAYDRKYPEWRSLFENVYASILTDNGDVLGKRKNADDFYEKILEKIPEWMAGYDGIIYSKAEKERAAKLLSRIRKPYVQEFFGQWTILLKASFFCFYALILYAVFLAGQIFSYENECGMDLLLVPCGKRKAQRIAYQKLGGVLVYLTFVITSCVLIQLLLIFICCGISGGNNSIQTVWEFISCLYPMTVWQFFLYSYLVAWVSLLCIVSVSAFLNAWTKNRYLSIALTALVLAFPYIMERTFEESAVIQRFAFLQPVTGIKVLAYGPSLRTFALGPIILRGGDAVLIECLVLLGVTFWLAPKVYWKKMRE